MRASMFAPLALVVVTAAHAQLPPSGPAVPRSVSSMPAMATAPIWAIDRSAVGRINQARIAQALSASGRSADALSDADRAAVQKAFEDLLPGEQFSRYRLNDPQAKAMVYLAFGPSAAESRPDDRRGGRGDGYEDRRERNDDRRGEDRGVRRLGRDEFERASDQAEWIRTAAPSLQQRTSRLTRDAELVVLQGMADRARSLELTVNRASCDFARLVARDLVTATRDAVELHQQSILSAWQGVGDTRLTNISHLADVVQARLVRCAGADR